MIQDLGGRTYNNHFEPKEPTPQSYVLCYGQDATVLAARSGDSVALPRQSDLGLRPELLTYLFSIDDDAFFLMGGDEKVVVPKGFEPVSVHGLRNAGATWQLFAAVTGWQLYNWYRDNRYCGTCGHPTQIVPTSREICCPACNRVIYPKICPGVIVGIVDRAANMIVLTKYANRPHTSYALVAGFTEIGEPIEDTVSREVMEEVGLRVSNLRFVGSQPWSFSDSLLVGFWCEVEGGTQITVDHVELKEAGWFAPHEMPDRSHDHVSLTGWMMERFKARGAAVLDE